MNKDQLFGIEHKKAIRRERDFPIHISNCLLEIDNKTEWIDSRQQLHNHLPTTSSRNKSLWTFMVMDPIQLLHPKHSKQLDKLSNWLQVTNNTLTYITDNFKLGNNTNIVIINDYIKTVTVPKLLGLPYINYKYKNNYVHKKLYNAFMQRVQEDRLRFFIELNKNQLLDQGYISFLGIISLNDTHNSIKQRQEYVDRLIYNVPDNVPVTVPYKNFIEPTGKFTDLEEQCKYSISYETYNNNDNIILDHNEWVIVTEKTLRSFQVPNISIIANTKGYYPILKNLGFEFDPINKELDNISNWNEQAIWLCNFLKDDPIEYNYKEGIEVAKHNSNIIEKMSRYLETDQFIKDIVKCIKN